MSPLPAWPPELVITSSWPEQKASFHAQAAILWMAVVEDKEGHFLPRCLQVHLSQVKDIFSCWVPGL